MGGVSVMAALFVIARFVVLRGLAMVRSGLIVVISRLCMVFA